MIPTKTLHDHNMVVNLHPNRCKKSFYIDKCTHAVSE